MNEDKKVRFADAVVLNFSTPVLAYGDPTGKMR